MTTTTRILVSSETDDLVGQELFSQLDAVEVIPYDPTTTKLDDRQRQAEIFVPPYRGTNRPMALMAQMPNLRMVQITAAGTDERVAALVYIAALAPDETEPSQAQQDKFARTPVFGHIEVADGRVWLRRDGTPDFCGDLSEQEQQLVWATQAVPVADIFDQKVEGNAWKSKPSRYIVGKNDRTVNPELQRFAAKRMGATTYELDSSHVPMLSLPKQVLEVVRAAATAVMAKHEVTA